MMSHVTYYCQHNLKLFQELFAVNTGNSQELTLSADKMPHERSLT
jgi:hypothetical protein